MSNTWISRDDVFAALEMHTVLDHYGIKSGRGSSFRIHCPFHDDERPSCSINPKGKVFNCFSCDSKGNVLDFIGEMEGLDPASEFRAVLETAVEILGHNPSKKNGRKNGNKNHQKSSNKEVAKTQKRSGKPLKDEAEEEHDDELEADSSLINETSSFRAAAKNHQSNKQKRKVKNRNRDDGSKIENAETGFVEDNDVDALPNKILEGPAFPLKLDGSHPYLKQRGFSQRLLKEFGIGFETRKSALMAGRICFPIHNKNGALVAYCGRWANDEDFVDHKGQKQDRYKLPTGFKKQLELYNLHRVTANFPDAKKIILVEGFWSVLRLHSLTRSVKGKTKVKLKAKTNIKTNTKSKPLITGIPTVGLMGLTISKPQIELLKETGFENIVVMLDGDEEGRKATQRLVCELSKYFFVKDANLPEGSKPDDVAKEYLLPYMQVQD